ncbi:MAG TPA: hypothetical protein VEG34_14330 [Thermoanaerobaculia bacterium]|nr:hypothetical protein [Thermoanaerobaculia bacterium]
MLPQTAGQPVEWLVVERGRGGRCLVLIADSNPLLGCADVAAPPEDQGGPLSVRCDAGLWVEVDSLRGGERSGAVAPGFLAEVRRRRAEVGTGTLLDPRLGAEGEPDPEYEDWLAEVVDPARAALLPTVVEDPGPIEPWAGTRLTVRLSVAAVLLLLVALGGASFLAWRFQQGEREARGQIESLQAGFLELAARHRSQLTAQRRSLVAAHRQEIAAQAARALVPSPPADVPGPLVNLAYASFYPKETRGTESELLMVPDGADYLILLFFVGHRDLCAEYGVEIARANRGAEPWNVDGLRPLPSEEVTVALPRDQLPDGRYRLRLQGRCAGRRQELGRYQLLVRSQAAR